MITSTPFSCRKTIVSRSPGFVASPITTRGMPNITIAPAHMKHGCMVVYIDVLWRLFMRFASRSAASSPCTVGLPDQNQFVMALAKHRAGLIINQGAADRASSARIALESQI